MDNEQEKHGPMPMPHERFQLPASSYPGFVREVCWVGLGVRGCSNLFEPYKPCFVDVLMTPNS